MRYPPFVYLPSDNDDDDDDDSGENADVSLKNNLQAYHDQFKVYPRQEDVGEYPRFIPYNSERRIFADATGRDFFEGKLTLATVHSDVAGEEGCFVEATMGCWRHRLLC